MKTIRLIIVATLAAQSGIQFADGGCNTITVLDSCVTEWRYTKAIQPGIQYCVPPCMSETKMIYGGKAYRWGIKPVVYFYVRNEETDEVEGPFKREIPQSEWAARAVWHTDNNPADDTRPHDASMAFVLPTQASEPHNLFGRAKLGTREYEVRISVSVFDQSISAAKKLTRGKEFSDREAVDELRVQRYCLCETCRSSSTPCVNTDCDGGCRDGLYGHQCAQCGHTMETGDVVSPEDFEGMIEAQ
ncbi:MAG: hypothetical protein N2595_07830 [bacterium]|nr:hypothetical protein [bacterium]